MKRKLGILLTEKEGKEIIKLHTYAYDPKKQQKRNFHNRYGKFFEYRGLKLTFEQWKQKGCSVRRLMQEERNKK